MNLMKQMMFSTRRSKFGFDATVAALREAAPRNGWEVPFENDLQEDYIRAGHEDMTRCTVLYFCNPHGGYDILSADRNKMLSIMMPTGVSVYETRRGKVKVATMNFGLMSNFFGGTTKRVFKEAAQNMAATLAAVVK